VGYKNCEIQNHHHHHHHLISFTQLGHLLNRSGLTYPEVSSKVYHDSFCQSDSSVSLPWVIYFEAFHLRAVSSFSCIPVIFRKLVLFFNSFAICAFEIQNEIYKTPFKQRKFAGGLNVGGIP